jgi:hypothetical protein
MTQDNGSIGNYWSDYLTKYPNASEVGNTGIGDTPYIIDANNVDNFPLMTLFEVQPASSSKSKAEPESFPTALIAAVSGVSITAVVAGVLVYFKKRKRKPE